MKDIKHMSDIDGVTTVKITFMGGKTFVQIDTEDETVQSWHEIMEPLRNALAKAAIDLDACILQQPTTQAQ